MKIVLTLQIPGELLRDLQGFPDHPLRNTDLAQGIVLRIRHMTQLITSI